MIYFDNAATTRQKPQEVIDAFLSYVTEIGSSAGRGSYSLGIQASRMLYNCRKTVANFFGLENSTNVVFTKNSTEAINLFLNGYLSHGDHVLISTYEHNAVLRPLEKLKREGVIDYSILPDAAIYEPDTYLESYIKPNTKLAAVTLASNLTGQYVYSKKLGKKLEEHQISVFVDASQGAGKRTINMSDDAIDYLAFTGHKDLLALPGIGGLCSQERLSFAPLIQGGTGIHGESYINPDIYPEAYEAGTLNMPAIWALKAAIDLLSKKKKEIHETEEKLLSYLLKEINSLNNITVYNKSMPRCATICFNVRGKSSSEVVSLLDKNNICVRGGIHCAILAHEALHTVETGAVRCSLNYNNTIEEIDKFIAILKEMN